MKCLNCQKTTNLYGANYNKYCNLICKREYERKKNKKHFSDIKCKICESVFTPKSVNNKFCSHKCKCIDELSKRSKKPKTKNCKQCEKEFKPYTSLDKFCCANCRVDFQKSKRTRNWKSVENKIGKKNAAYVHGLAKTQTLNLKQREYMRIRNAKAKSIIEEQGFICCQRCGSTGCKIETHHIVFRSEKPSHEHIHNERNLIFVCVKCHNYFHKNKSNRNYLVEDRNLTELFGDDILR